MTHHKPHCSILLVEDSPDDAFFFKRIVKKSGIICDLEHVMDGRAAINHLTARLSNPPLLVFLDLKMPIVSGFEVLTWLGGQDIRRKLKVVVLSGSDDKSDRERAAKLGAAHYMVKPITLEMFQREVPRLQPGHFTFEPRRAPGSAQEKGAS
jgi:CheY-like chemotaxis protein